MRDIRIGFGQINPVVGDFAHNIAAIKEQISKGKNCDLLIFGELALCGYPLGDLSYRDDVISATEDALAEIVNFTSDFPELTVVIGHVSKATTRPESQVSYAKAHNSASVIRSGEVLGRYDKQRLPNYDVFDDWRNFVPGSTETIFEVAGTKVAVAICEDIWDTDSARPAALSKSGVELLVVPNGSPYTRTKQHARRVAARSFQSGFAIAYANLSGGQDDLVFDGDSFLLDAQGNEVMRAPFGVGLFQESIDLTEIKNDDPERLWTTLVTAVRDYASKTGQERIVLGLSGGIDSALCAAIAVEALGPNNVLGVALPSRYSSDHSLSDAEQLAKNLGCDFQVQPIAEAHEVLETQLGLTGLAAENVQARIRAVILMGIANQESRLLLTTGNKSEVAVGYSTIYGDSAGGFAPIKDVLKTDVWRLARWLNNTRGKELIPVNSIEKAPSAELRPGQTDQDSLPDYQLLDDILRLLIERFATVSEVVALGFDEQLVRRVDDLVRKAEWKRSQGAIGPKTTDLSFGSGRRVPITTRFGKL